MNSENKTDGLRTSAEEAGEWCVRLSTGGLTADEQARFDHWLDEHEANSKAFDRALTAWSGLHAIAETPEMISQRADALDALRRANRRRWSPVATGRWRMNLAWAASLVLLVASSLWFVALRPLTYSTGLGERRAILLADGSRVSLDAETRVEIALKRDHRELRLLAGRAKFDVAKDPARPFTVTAGDRTVIATGTAFSVELLRKQVHVIVYEGSVAVVKGELPPASALLAIKAHPGLMAVGLTSGRQLAADLDSQSPPNVSSTDISRSSGWEEGQLNFVDEPLADAVERLNRYSPKRIVIADAKTAAITVNGVFNAGESDAFADAIVQAYSVRERQIGADLILSQRLP